MKQGMWLVALATLGVFGHVNVWAVTGKTPGQFSVSSVGSAQYSIPIWTPPGPQGVQPNLALTYDSNSGIGTMGVGWYLAGIGSIRRCNKTYAQDTVPAPVALITTDGYCINGNRLRLISGTYGTAGSTYKTEIADFSLITANGTQGNGPQYFTVQAKNGLTYQYGYVDSNGNGANSQVTAAGTADIWYLSKVSDRSTNNLVINYSTVTGDAVPNTILWTPATSGSSTYQYEVLFNYPTANVPQSSLTKYISGTAVTNNQLLSSIQIFYTGTLVKEYFLHYQASPTTGRNELISVHECADSGETDCLTATTISYPTANTIGVSTSPSTALSSTGAALTARYDLNGDGIPDLTYEDGTTGIFKVAFGSTTGGYSAPISTGFKGQILIGNVNGGAEDGILVKNSDGTWWYYTWSGSVTSGSFSGATTNAPFNTNAVGFQLADIDGDGLPELVDLEFSAANKNYHANVNYLKNITTAGNAATFSTSLTSSGIMPIVVSAQLQTPDSQWGKLRRFDFNGDGRDDLVLETTTGSGPTYTLNTVELISNGTGFASKQVATGSSSTFTSAFFTNWNDDACTDFVSGTQLFIAGCDGTVSSGITLGTVVGAMDWDGDGRTDILINNNGTLGVYFSTGSAPVAGNFLTTTVAYSSNCQYVAMDSTGDGLDDLGCWSQSGVGALTYYPHNGAGQRPDLVSSITDGYGLAFSPTYVSLALAGGSYGKGSIQNWPEQDYDGPRYVVSSYAASTGTSNYYGTSYTVSKVYSGAVVNVQGRGFEGFLQIRSLDSRNSTYHYQYYGTAFPFTGMSSYESFTNSGNYLQTIGNLTSSITLDSSATNGQVYPYIGKSTVTDYEVGGAENGQAITTTVTTLATPDNYGNFPSVTKVITDKDTQSANSRYANQSWTTTVAMTYATADTTNWCVGLPTQMTLTKSDTAGGGSPITITTNYTEDTDPTKCRNTQQVVQPGTSYQVTTADLFDGFGNIYSETVTGTGMSGRQTQANWGTATGQFPLSSTNALGQTSSFTYDYSKGVPLTSKDPNGLVTQWFYDEFFRKTKELRPDQTSTTWAYNACGAGCVNGNNMLTVVQQRINTDNSVLRTDNTYYDQLNRVLVTSGQMLNGSYDRHETQYDTLGRIGRQSVPCSFSGCNDYWTVSSYDALNRLTQTQRPISATNSNPQYTYYTHQGRLLTIKDANGNSTTRTYLVTGAESSVGDANGYIVSTYRDAFDSPVRVLDNQSTPVVWSTKTWAYGAKPFMTASSDLSVGNYTYTVDPLGETTAYTDLKNQNFSVTYDALSRPLVRTEPDFVTTWTWGTTAASHEIGQLKNVVSTTPTGSNQYTDAYVYDSDGRLQERQLTLPIDGQHNFDYAYSPTTGLLSSLAYPTSANPATYRVTPGYTYKYGLLSTIFDSNATSTIWWQATATNYRGQITAETTSSGSSAPQIISSRNFDAVTGWVNTIQSGSGGGAGLQNEAYTYDLVGNVTQRQNIRVGLTENFYYDDVNRLNCSTLNQPAGSSGCVAQYVNLQMCYDNTGGACLENQPGPGNITSRSDVAGGAAWTYDPTHKQYVTQAGSASFTYQYDHNGNVNNRNGSNIGSTSYNYPSYVQTGTESASFDYGPDRQRWRMIYQNSGGMETTYYATSLYEKVATSSGTDYRHYIYAGSRQVMVISRTSANAVNVRSLLTDHQGSISTIVTDSTGVADVNESFTAYGVRRDPTTWSGAPNSGDLTTMNGVTREGYTFQTVLGSMGLNHMNGRVQDAVTGVFLSADPTIPAPGNTINYHHMGYANHNPLTYTDPTGFSTSRFCKDWCPNENSAYYAGWGGSGAGEIDTSYLWAEVDANIAGSIWDPNRASTTVSSSDPTTTSASSGTTTSSSPVSSNSNNSAQSQDSNGQSAGTAQSAASSGQLAEITVTAQAQNGPLVAQLIDPVIDPILQTAIDTGRVPTLGEQLAGRPQYVPRIGVPPPLPQVAPPPPWWLQVLQWLGSAIDRIGGVSPAAPPVCTGPVCSA